MFHIKFGNGDVVAVDGPKLTVEFDRAGRKMVLDSFVSAAEVKAAQAAFDFGVTSAA